MTLAFTFPIKDAWVIVADKGVISRLDTTDKMSEKTTTFSDNEIKIKSLENDLFFVGAGNQEYLERIIEVINKSKSFHEFKKEIVLKIAEAYGSFESTIPKNEVFLIIDKNSQEAIKFDTCLMSEDVYSLGITKLKNNFIGCFKENTNLGYVKIKIASFRNMTFEQVGNSFFDLCNDMLSLLSIDYPNLVGHPSIQGSNIWVISKEKVKKVFTFPKNDYNYEVK
ncbi:MAG: hypothetical protein ABIJ60_03060 [Patescibacteria group bacterium]